MINFIVDCWKFGPKNLQVNLPNESIFWWLFSVRGFS